LCVLDISEIGSQRTYCPGCHLTMILLISTSQVPRITGVNHPCPARCLNLFSSSSPCSNSPSLTLNASLLEIYSSLSNVGTPSDYY
jgi:hypothetical protein